MECIKIWKMKPAFFQTTKTKGWLLLIHPPSICFLYSKKEKNFMGLPCKELVLWEQSSKTFFTKPSNDGKNYLYCRRIPIFQFITSKFNCVHTFSPQDNNPWRYAYTTWKRAERKGRVRGGYGPLISDSSNIHLWSRGMTERSFCHRTSKLRLLLTVAIGFVRANEVPRNGVGAEPSLERGWASLHSEHGGRRRGAHYRHWSSLWELTLSTAMDGLDKGGD